MSLCFYFSGCSGRKSLPRQVVTCHGGMTQSFRSKSIKAIGKHASATTKTPQSQMFISFLDFGHFISKGVLLFLDLFAWMFRCCVVNSFCHHFCEALKEGSAEILVATDIAVPSSRRLNLSQPHGAVVLSKGISLCILGPAVSTQRVIELVWTCLAINCPSLISCLGSWIQQTFSSHKDNMVGEDTVCCLSSEIFPAGFLTSKLYALDLTLEGYTQVALFPTSKYKLLVRGSQNHKYDASTCP